MSAAIERSSAGASTQITSANTDAYDGGDLASINASRLRGGRNSSTRVVINTNAEST